MNFLFEYCSLNCIGIKSFIFIFNQAKVFCDQGIVCDYLFEEGKRLFVYQATIFFGVAIGFLAGICYEEVRHVLFAGKLSLNFLSEVKDFEKKRRKKTTK